MVSLNKALLGPYFSEGVAMGAGPLWFPCYALWNWQSETWKLMLEISRSSFQTPKLGQFYAYFQGAFRSCVSFQGPSYGRLALEPPLGKSVLAGWLSIFTGLQKHHSMSQNGNLSPILKIKIKLIPQPGRYLVDLWMSSSFSFQNQGPIQLKQRGHLDFIYVYIRGNHNVKGAPLKESIRTFFSIED